MDIMDFWAVCLEEDKLWAQQASRDDKGYLPSGVHWQWVNPETDEPDSLVPFIDDGVGNGRSSLRSVEEYPYKNLENLAGPIFAIRSAEEVPVAVGGHIVRNDPASTLLRVESEKRLLVMCRNGSLGGNTEAVALAVVQRYAEHPHFKDEWKLSDISVGD